LSAYLTSPFSIRPALLPGINAYSFGSFDDHNPGTRMLVTAVAITTNVATLTVQILEGPIPVVSATSAPLITVQGTKTVTSGGAPNFNVTNVALASVSITASTGKGTVTLALTSSNIATTVDSGMALVPPPELSEALTAVAGLQFAMQAVSGLASNSRDVSWVIATPSAPSSFTAALQIADVDQEAEYTAIDTTTAIGLRVVLGVRANFIRIKYTAVSGGTNPTSIAKILT
jgi:hypothetical protein